LAFMDIGVLRPALKLFTVLTVTQRGLDTSLSIHRANTFVPHNNQGLVIKLRRGTIWHQTLRPRTQIQRRIVLLMHKSFRARRIVQVVHGAHGLPVVMIWGLSRKC